MVIQARWVHESPLVTLPHVEAHHLYVFKAMAQSTGKCCTVPAGLKMGCQHNYEALAGPLRSEFDDHQIEQIHKVRDVFVIIVTNRNPLVYFYYL